MGPYQVLAKLGEGGTGEVYRARDTKLNRDVAIKVLPEAFALDADRLARFYGIEECAGQGRRCCPMGAGSSFSLKPQPVANVPSM